MADNTNDKYKKEVGGGAMLRSAILDKNGLPMNVRRKMASPSGGNVRIGNPRFYHPLFEPTNISLPRDRRERNEWCRHFYRTEPIIATALDLHTEFPIGNFSNICPDPHVNKFYDYLVERIDMINLLLEIGLEYWKIGDVIVFGQLNEEEGIWDKFVILNPDFIDIKASILADEPEIELIPDDELRSIIAGGSRGPYGTIYERLPEDVVRYVRMNKNIPLDNRLVSHIAHKASPYEVWGTPLMMRCFKTLIYKDKLRTAQQSIADRHIFPLRIFKIGQAGEPYPSQEDLDSFRDMLVVAEDDPNFVLVYHYALQTDYVGSSGRILPLNTEFDFIEKELLTGLGISQGMISGDTQMANAQVAYDTLARRYMSYRLKLESWIRNKIYKPIAEIQGFYKPIASELNARYRIANRSDRELMYPEIAWQQEDLSSNQSIMNFIQQLQQKGLVSMTTILPILGLDPDTEKRNLEKERGTVFDPNAPKGMLPSGAEGMGLGGPGGGGGAPLPPIGDEGDMGDLGDLGDEESGLEEEDLGLDEENEGGEEEKPRKKPSKKDKGEEEEEEEETKPKKKPSKREENDEDSPPIEKAPPKRHAPSKSPQKVEEEEPRRKRKSDVEDEREIYADDEDDKKKHQGVSLTAEEDTALPLSRQVRLKRWNPETM